MGRWQTLHSNAPALSEAFVNENFDSSAAPFLAPRKGSPAAGAVCGPQTATCEAHGQVRKRTGAVDPGWLSPCLPEAVPVSLLTRTFIPVSKTMTSAIAAQHQQTKCLSPCLSPGKRYRFANMCCWFFLTPHCFRMKFGHRHDPGLAQPFAWRSWLSASCRLVRKANTKRSKHSGTSGTAIVPTTRATAIRCNSMKVVSPEKG